MKIKKIKTNRSMLFVGIVCFIIGILSGYLLFVCIENNAHSTGNVLTCNDGSNPDSDGCCPGEIYTDMGDLGFNCCPEDGGDCYPPIK